MAPRSFGNRCSAKTICARTCCVAAGMTGFAFSDFYTFRLKEPRGPHDSKVDSSFHVQKLQVSELSHEIYSWHHDHIPLLKFLFARGVACVVFFQQ